MGLCGSAKIKVYEFDADEAGLNHKQKKKFDDYAVSYRFMKDITKFYSVWRKIEPTGNNLVSEHDYIANYMLKKRIFKARLDNKR